MASNGLVNIIVSIATFAAIVKTKENYIGIIKQHHTLLEDHLYHTDNYTVLRFLCRLLDKTPFNDILRLEAESPFIPFSQGIRSPPKG